MCIVIPLHQFHSLLIILISTMNGLFQPNNSTPTPTFSNFNQPSQNQPSLAPNPFNELPPNTPTLDGKPIYPYYSQHILNVLDTVYQSQEELTIRGLLMLLQTDVLVSKEVIERACELGIAKQWQKSQSVDPTVQRCKKIKNKNINIITRIMNLRVKLVKNMNMYKSRSSDKEQEIGMLHEKIRATQSDINAKYNKLKMLRNIRKQQISQPQIPIIRIPGQVPLIDLKRGVELIEQETIKLWEELNILKKFMHGKLN